MDSLQRYATSARNRLRTALNPWLLHQFCPELPVEDALVVAGSNRSGTTWLQEVIASIPHSVKVFEPLHIDAVPNAKRAGFHKLKYLAPETPFSDGEAYLRKVLCGREWNSYTAMLNQMSECFAPEQLVVKFIHANGILEWMTRRLPVKQPVVVIRHPCAVIASVLNLNWSTDSLRNDLLASELVRESLPLRNYIEGLQTPVEQLAARWCLENVVLFNMQNPNCIKRVTYESLVSGGPGMLIDIFRGWDIEVPDKLTQQFQKESTLSAQNRNYHSSEQRLSKWQTEVPRPQVHAILNVLEAFGLNFYSDRIHPDYQRLEACQPSHLLQPPQHRQVA